MKKLLILIFVLLNFYQPILASDRPSYYFQPLPIKDGELELVGLYNIYIEDYNKFKSEFDTQVFDFCADLLIPGGGARQFPQEATCIYNAADGLLKKYNFQLPFYETHYRHYKNHFELAKTSALTITKCGNKSCQKELINNYVDRWFKLDEKLFSDFDYIIKNSASERQTKYISNQN